MAQAATLRLAFFSLNLAGGVSAILVLLLSFFNRNRHNDGLLAPVISLSITRLLSVIFSCLLLFAGTMAGSSVSDMLCRIQSGFQVAQAPLLTSGILSFAINLSLVAMNTPSSSRNLVQSTKILVLGLPFGIFASLSLAGLLVAFSAPYRDTAPFLYCILNNEVMWKTSTIFSIVISIATFIPIMWLMAHGCSSYLAIFCSVYSMVFAGMLIAKLQTHRIFVDLFLSADPLIVSLAVFLQRLATFYGPQRPAHDPDSQESPARPGTRQTANPPTIEIIVTSTQRDSVAEPKLYALTRAMGLSTQELPIQEAEPNQEGDNGSLKSQELHVTPYAIDLGQDSPSIRSVQYGVALGHPSRDASRTHTPVNIVSEVRRSFMAASRNSHRPGESRESVGHEISSGSDHNYSFDRLRMLRVHSSTPSVDASALESSVGDRGSPRRTAFGSSRHSPLQSTLNKAAYTNPVAARSNSQHHQENGSDSRLSRHLRQDGTMTSVESDMTAESSAHMLGATTTGSVSWPDVSTTSTQDPTRTGHREHAVAHTHSRFGAQDSPISDPSFYDPLGFAPPMSRFSTSRDATPSPLLLDEDGPHSTFLSLSESSDQARRSPLFRPPGLDTLSYPR